MRSAFPVSQRAEPFLHTLLPTETTSAGTGQARENADQVLKRHHPHNFDPSLLPDASLSVIPMFGWYSMVIIDVLVSVTF